MINCRRWKLAVHILPDQVTYFSRAATRGMPGCGRHDCRGATRIGRVSVTAEASSARPPRIDHVGVIVDDLEKACEFLRSALQLEVDRSVERSDLRSSFFKCGPISIEMIEVLDADQREARLGAGRSARIEHIAIEVDDLEETLARLQTFGVSPTAPPRRTADYRTFWTDPSTSDGVMYQFLERDRKEPLHPSGAE